MKGLISKGLLMACGAVALATAGGCYTCSDFIDVCWPERYEAMARAEVHEASGPQVHNGHVLDQTIWNYQFELGSDKLTPGGMDHLDYLARRRPAPDVQLYLQTAHDVVYDPATAEKFAETRSDLDNKRVAAIQKYLAATTAGRHADFQVGVHDPADPGISAIPANNSVRAMYAGAVGVLGGGGASTTGGGGASGGR
jgi:hypothetical protein